jgi:sodium transport system ATP-binding protein
MIHVRNLSKRYPDLRHGQIVAIERASFDALPGEVFALVGPNGAGKTTLLRILSTVLQPTAGSATVNGYDVVANSTEVRRQIGFVSVNTAIYDRMTGWELVEYFGRLHELADEVLAERMESLFARFQMDDLRHLMGSRMSTGMKQKVSIARALVHDPPVLIFDEATSGLDVLAARELLETVEQLRDHGKCIIFSSHIMNEVQRISDRLAILHRGRIIEQGSLDELAGRHDCANLEDLFYRMISTAERRHASITSAVDWSVAPCEAEPTR